MKKLVTTNTKRIALLVIVLSTLAAFKAKKTNILIIGDSISIGYTPFVQKKLKGKAEVFHNPKNAQHTGNGLEKIHSWIKGKEWDVIQFNWGLWDLCYRHDKSKEQGKRDKVNGKITYPIEGYAKNLEKLVSILESTGAKLIFVTTTYVPEQEAGRFQEDPIKYNRVAKEIMKKHNIQVNDIFETSIKVHKEYGNGNDDVHYSEEGYAKLSEPIIKMLEKHI